MKNYKKNLHLLKENNVYSEDMEHDACGVQILRVHDVNEVNQSIKIFKELIK